MKIKKIILALLVFTFFASLFAVEESPSPLPKQVQARGANAFGDETLESLQTTGLVKLNRTTVSQNLSVNGSLITHGAVIGSVDVMGEAHLTDTVIRNGGLILGYLQAHHTVIEQTLILNGQKAVFSASKLKAITIRQMESFKGKQIIELRQKTLIDGPITFESGKGEVHIYSGSQVLGPINGGKAVKKN